MRRYDRSWIVSADTLLWCQIAFAVFLGSFRHLSLHHSLGSVLIVLE